MQPHSLQGLAFCVKPCIALANVYGGLSQEKSSLKIICEYSPLQGNA